MPWLGLPFGRAGMAMGACGWHREDKGRAPGAPVPGRAVPGDTEDTALAGLHGAAVLRGSKLEIELN